MNTDMNIDGATIVTTGGDDELGEVTITRDFDFPREMLFAAFFDPEQLTHFWGPPGVSTPLETITIDARPGGVFATTMVDDASGAEYPNQGVFIEIVEPERFSWREDNGLVTSSTLTDLGDGRCRLVIHQTNAPPMFRSADALEGFNASLTRMSDYLTARRS
jgi:uncharacterized protein YndB with AHSA1/START domain